MNYVYDGINEKTFKELYETRSFNDNSKEFRNNIFLGFKLFSLNYPLKKNINPLLVLNSMFDVKKIDLIKKMELYNYIKDVYYYFLKSTKFDKETKEYIFIDTKRGYNFNFSLLSDNIDNKYYRRVLCSKEKFHKCHSGSMQIIKKMDNAYLCTGYIDNYGINTLHTIIETDENYVIDYTLNLIIQSKIYKELTNFREIQRIKKEDYLNDLKVIDTNTSSKFYLTFRDEIINDLNKNKKVLKLDKEIGCEDEA